MESPKQNYLNGIIFTNKMKESWLAEELSKRLHYEITPQVLNYQLHGAEEIKDKYYKEIIEIFKESGLITDKENICRELGQITLTVTHTLNSQLSLLQKEVASDIEDDELKEDERLRIKSILPELRLAIKEATTRVNNIEKIIETLEPR